MTSPAPSQPRDGSALLVACMRNEGLFLVEWLAYHLLLGFDHIVVCTNNCTDGSDALLTRLQELGYVTHIDHDPAPGVSPQHNAMRLTIAHPVAQECEWMMHIDADEFVNIDAENGHIGDVIQAVGPADVIAFLWQPYGNAGLTEWEGGSVLQTFTKAQSAPLRRTVHHKSIWKIAKFGRAIDHMPKDPLVDDFVVKNTAGEEVSGRMIRHPIKCRYKMPLQQLTYKNARLNHYALKSDDLLLMKNDRGDGHGLEHQNYYLNSQYYRKYNRNEIDDTSILSRWDDVAKKMAEIREDAQIAELEKICWDTFKARRAEVLTPENIDRWTVHPAPE